MEKPDRSSLDREKEIYARQAETYERLIAREDHQNNLLPALEQIMPLAGLDVIDLGAGTGRLARLLAPRVRQVHAFDLSTHMLRVARGELMRNGWRNWSATAADHRCLPAASRCADLLVSGWSLCYLVAWGDQTWPAQVDQALAEMERMLRPGGRIILLETLGTGYETPHPPEHLQDYYAHLKGRGFASTWIRTDYRFASLAEAEELARFFFGEELAQRIVERHWVELPECTGIWWKDRAA